jgi:type IV pilus assembly protein PilA
MKSRGFTLIELMMVVAIIGILAAVALPAYQRYVYKAKSADLLTHIDAVRVQAATYAATEGWPAQLTDAGWGKLPKELQGFPQQNLVVDRFTTTITEAGGDKPVLFYFPHPASSETNHILAAAYEELPHSVVSAYKPDQYLAIYLFDGNHQVHFGNNVTPVKKPTSTLTAVSKGGGKAGAAVKVVTSPTPMQVPVCPPSQHTYHANPNPNDPCAKPMSQAPANYCPPSQIIYVLNPDPAKPCQRAAPHPLPQLVPPKLVNKVPVIVQTAVPHPVLATSGPIAGSGTHSGQVSATGSSSTQRASQGQCTGSLNWHCFQNGTKNPHCQASHIYPDKSWDPKRGVSCN